MLSIHASIPNLSVMRRERIRITHGFHIISLERTRCSRSRRLAGLDLLSARLHCRKVTNTDMPVGAEKTNSFTFSCILRGRSYCNILGALPDRAIR